MAGKEQDTTHHRQTYLRVQRKVRHESQSETDDPGEPRNDGAEAPMLLVTQPECDNSEGSQS